MKENKWSCFVVSYLVDEKLEEIVGNSLELLLFMAELNLQKVFVCVLLR